MSRILIVEDEPSLLLTLTDNLRFEGHDVLQATRGDEGLALAQSEELDLILLDIMLPGLDGFSFCRELKAERPGLPILIVSARDQSTDVVRGLELGADDYIKKPFELSELLARVRVRLRLGKTQTKPESYEFGGLIVDFNRMELVKNGEPLALTDREFRVLSLFIERRGEVVSRDELLNRVWGYQSFPTTRTVDNYILKLRKLIEEDPANPRWLISVRSVGYRFMG
ncbi:MAG: response regulator transcription factor [Myxococcales bacterium]|nr:response regulator transcription factor [Myxococcales bacterium]